MQRWGWDLGWLYLPGWVQVCDYSRFWCLTSMDLPWWFCEHSAYRIPKQTACILTAEAGQRALPNTVSFVSLQNGLTNRQHHTGHFPVDSSYGRILNGSSSNRSTPVPSPHTTAQKWIWELLFQQLGSRPGPQQGCDNHRAKKRPHSTSRAGAGHHYINHIHYQGDNSQHTWRKRVAATHTRNSPHNKNIRCTQATQGWSHIKTALQEHSR